MTVSRRRVLVGGGALAAAALGLPAAAQAPVEIVMEGTADGGRVWFNPAGVHIQPGQTVRWVNRDKGNSHTATAYAAAAGRPQRIPEGAEAWDSGYLLPDESFEVTLTTEGAYDYYCVPHEHAGMVGRIVVGSPPPGEPYAPATGEPLPDAALTAFPQVSDILAAGEVRRE